MLAGRSAANTDPAKAEANANPTVSFFIFSALRSHANSINTHNTFPSDNDLLLECHITLKSRLDCRPAIPANSH
jgi:hypothetical protein